MRVADLFERIPHTILCGDANLEISGIETDSRKVKKETFL
jgi:hypothetical protein